VSQFDQSPERVLVSRICNPEARSGNHNEPGAANDRENNDRIDRQKHPGDLFEGRPESLPGRIIGDILWLNQTRGQTIPKRTAMADGTPIKDRALAERALRKWLVDLEDLVPEAQVDEHFVLLEENKDCVAVIAAASPDAGSMSNARI
jgi:hypothetical protein